LDLGKESSRKYAGLWGQGESLDIMALNPTKLDLLLH
jgi:hypothetical protein